jgi:hypothetical protein
MNRKLIPYSSIACAIIVLFGADLVRGQTAPPVAARAVIGVTIAETQLLAAGYRASKLLHQDVYNAVVNVGGFLGLGKHLVAIPVRQFAQIAPRAVLPNASKQELKALPKFEYV